jgi:hypothetical protein
MMGVFLYKPLKMWTTQGFCFYVFMYFFLRLRTLRTAPVAWTAHALLTSLMDFVSSLDNFFTLDNTTWKWQVSGITYHHTNGRDNVSVHVYVRTSAVMLSAICWDWMDPSAPTVCLVLPDVWSMRSTFWSSDNWLLAATLPKLKQSYRKRPIYRLHWFAN